MSTMNNNYSILGFLVAITVVLSYKVDMSVSPRIVNLGSTLTVTCTGTQDQAGVLPPGMEIHKKILGTIYTISDGDRLNVPYASNARYSIKKSNPTSTTYTFILTVKNTSLEDSGLFSCDFKIVYKDVISKKTTINVLHPPTLIKLTAPSNVSGEIRVKPNVGIAVKCLVQNYSPDAPSSAMVLVGDMDVTDNFRKTTTNVVTGDQKLEAGGLVKIVYTTELNAGNFVIEAGYSGKMLRCASSIGGNSKVDSMNSVNIFVEVPREPIQFTLTSRSTHLMAFAWEEPAIKNGYIIGYKVTCENVITGIQFSVETSDLFVKISNLLPGQEYICTAAARTKKGYGRNSTVLSGWTKPIAPRPMEPRFEQATDTTLTFELPPAQPGVTRYQLVVDTVGGRSFDDRRKRQTAGGVSKLTGCSGDVNNDDVYITAELLSNHVSQRFTVGDDQTYGRYRNCPLYKGRQYDIYYGSVIVSKSGDKAVSFIKINGTFKAVTIAEESGHDLGIAIGCACAGVIIIAVVILCYRRRNSTVTSSSKWWRRKQSGQKDILAKEEPNYVNTVVCFHASEDNDGYEDLHGFSREESPVYAEIKQDYVTSSPAREATKAPKRKMFSLVDDLNAKINKKKATNNRLFNQEFQRITAKTENNLVGRKKENMSKNRHGVHITYDHSRVVLLSGEDDSNSDYINASHIKNYQSEDCYIVTQVPLHHTFCDFWRMVWQEHVAFIVIIGGQHQDDFDQFWPEKNSLFTYDDIRITTIKDDQEKNCIITTIQTTKEGESRNVFLMQLGAGESIGNDHEHIKSFLGYTDMFEKLNTIRRPTIVIDSGINDVSSPPGIFIALNLLLNEAEAGKRIDVGLCVETMFHQRAGMINTLEEYIFLHDLLYAAIQADVTAVPVSTFLSYYETICHVAPETMSQLYHQFQIARGTVDTDHNREFGKTQTIKDSIRDDAFVIMNVSMTDSPADIWTTMDDHGSRTLVTFTNSSDSEKVRKQISPHDSTTPLNLKKFKISLLKNESDDGIVKVRKLEVSKRFKKSTTVTKVVDVKDWPDDDSIFDTTKSIVALLYVIDPWLRQTDGAPIAVICRSGMESRCGTFVALIQILKKLKSEEKVDVFGVVKRMIRHHSQYALNEMQFRFCYDVIAAYVRTLHV